MAEHAIALMLSLARALPVYAVEQNDGAFTRGFRETRGERPIEIEGKTLLVVGLGGIGTEVAKRAHGLGHARDRDAQQPPRRARLRRVRRASPTSTARSRRAPTSS